MKNIYIFLFCCCAFLIGNNLVFGQNCTTALQPMSVVATSVGPSGIPITPPGSLAQSGAINVAWDPQCGTRGGDGCEFGDDNSLFWYVGIYGQNAPTPNGANIECGITSVTLDCPAVAPAVGLVVNDGGDYNGLCLAPKASTCTSSEFSQMRPPGTGDITSWHTFGDDGTGMLGACDGPALNLTLPVCAGQCYNVVVWEFVIDQPSGTGNNANGGAGGTGNMLPFAGMDANISCGNMTLLSESPPSDVVSICIDAPDGSDNALMENPTLTVTNSVNGDPALSVCDGLNDAAYTGTFQSQPEDIGDPSLADPCEGSNTDVCNSIGNISDPLTSDGSVDQTIGGTGNGGDAGDLSVVLGGAGNSANGELGLGAHVIEVNCREDIGIVFSTPEGCKGFTDQSQFGLPACSFSDGTLLSTNAKVYVSVNGTPVPGTAIAPYPACYTGGSGAGTCPTNNAMGYGADYTAVFGNFISDDGAQCITNLVGNPFEGSGTNPFTLPGAISGVDFGDGVARDVSTVCVKYEDPCDGSKSITCIKFISDASPMEATIRACNESCPGAADGKIVVHDIAGGSDDPNSDSAYTDGNMGAYVLDIVAGPVTGQIFTYSGGSTWETPGTMPPGLYTVDIYDSLAPMDTFDDDSDDATAMCGAACPIQLVVEILAGPIITCIDPAVVAGDCAGPVMSSVQIDKIATLANGQVEGMGGPGMYPGSFAGTYPDCNNIDATNDIAISGMFAGCPSDAIGPTTFVEICLDNITDGIDITGVIISLCAPGGGVLSWAGTAFAPPTDPLLTGNNVTACFNVSTAFVNNLGGPANGTWSISIDDGFGGATTIDGWSITLNDQMCTTEADIQAFCATAGPDEGDGVGAITSVDQTITWTSADPNESATEPFNFVTLSGPGENDLSFDAAAASAAGVPPGTQICYDAMAFVPGNEFDAANAITDNTGFATSCYVGACCPVSCQVCFTTLFCFACEDPDPPILTPAEICTDDPAEALDASCAPCATIGGVAGTSSIIWYSDAAGTAQVGTGGSFIPADVAAGVYPYYAKCVCDYGADGTCESTLETVDYTINQTPTVSIDNLSFGCGGGAQPLNPAPVGGVYSGSGAGVVNNDSVSDADLSDGVTYDLTYTYTDPATGCTDSASITFQFNIDCEAEGGAFPSSGP